MQERMDYGAFLGQKRLLDTPTGLIEVPPLNPVLFAFQADIVRWALRRGRAAVFADCGMGKTPIQLEWAKHVPGRVLILAPLAVAAQTVREGVKFGIPVVYARHQSETDAPIVITNYEMMEHFDAAQFTGVVLDESSILKSYDGATRNAILAAFAQTPFRLACTATPAPNDFMELGNHAEFVGAMDRTEMLAMFFVHDGGETQKWRIKGHARRDFWRWVCSWAVMLRKPSDMGYDDDGFLLPPIHFHHRVVEGPPSEGALFALEAQSLQERIAVRRESIQERVAETAALVAASSEPWVVWCNLNAESEALARTIPGAVAVSGSDDADKKRAVLEAFTEGRIRVMVTKPTIAGFGLNWQHCAHVAFVGLSDSYEQFYQAVRRCWRFGQTMPVHLHVITADSEGAVVANIKRKEVEAAVMAEEMVREMADFETANVRGITRDVGEYERETATGEGWRLELGDAVEVVGAMPADSVHYSIFSPPFASLYTYSNSPRDMGNVQDGNEFAEHFTFLIKELYRVTMPGRLVSFHCMNLPTSKVRDGVIGLRDFRGELISLFESEGWIFHSEVCIWKDPVTAMQRTKALGLLYKQLRKDSAMSRQGIPDYLVTMRKGGDNPERVTKTHDRFPVGLWQRFASPVWMDINPSDTLQFRSAREDEDERHICPLQLDVIRRAVVLWTNPGDTVLSPFAGIGSEGYVAIEQGRQFLGIELKRSYWEQACRNLDAAKQATADLFSGISA